MTRDQLLRSLVCSHEGASLRVYELAGGDHDRIRSILSSPAKLFAILKGASRCTARELEFALSRAPDEGDNLASDADVYTIQAQARIGR